MKCLYCETEAIFVSSKEFYGKDYKTNIYSCVPCDAYVGTHGNSETPLGTMANSELRECRKKAHLHFDKFWKSREMSRSEAYKWMANQMGLGAKGAHIAMFDVGKCEILINKIKREIKSST